MKVKVIVTLKNGVLDPQGKAILQTLNGMSFSNIEEVRQGKFFEINVNSNSAENDDKGDSNVEESPDDDNSELTETNTLNFVMGYEIILMIMIALIFRSRN